MFYFMFLCINNEKPLEKCKTIRTKIEGLKNIKLNALPVYDDRYIKTDNYYIKNDSYWW